MRGIVHVLVVAANELDSEPALENVVPAGVDFEQQRVVDPAGFKLAVGRQSPDVIVAGDMLPAFEDSSILDLAKKLSPGTPVLFIPKGRGGIVGTDGLEARAPGEPVRSGNELMMLNADLERFAYAASHDLQEPLRTMSLFSKLLAKRYRGALDAEADEYLTFIESAAKHMIALLEDLLIYTKLPSRRREFEPVDLNEVMEETLAFLQPVITESRAAITVDPLPQVEGRVLELGLVLRNLIGNALKYRGEDSPLIHVGAKRADDHWVISVKDNGIGFEQNYAEQIFELFKRLNNREHPGTGLGLAICKRIIEVHGGRIWAESKPQQGSIFFFSLPFKNALENIEP
jgi:light-regulated signal transduction histidine kinase (bacteriophytochrome)